MLIQRIICNFLFFTLLLTTSVFGQTTGPKIYEAPKEIIDKIKDEGINRSQIGQTLSYLTDIIGGRLTNSPNMKRANEWTRDVMTKWGLQNARLEAWGIFGRGWLLKGFTAQVISPQFIPVIAYPKAWSPSTNNVLTSEVVYLNAETDEEFAKFKDQLTGKIVLISNLRPLKAEEKPLSTRFSETELLAMANAPDPIKTESKQTFSPIQTKNFIKFFTIQAKRLNFAVQERAAAIVDNSERGSGGTIFITGANVAREIPQNAKTIPEFVQQFFGESSKPYRKDAESRMLPQLTMASEDYNRLVRMIGFGIRPVMTVEINARYCDEDLMGYNTIAEIPGSDPKLKDEFVMLGGHLDSWHSSTGATDNGAGAAVTMEAARIILAAGLKPRRTIRVALWSGEEQGLLGSANYVRQHFGTTKEGILTKSADYEKLSAYYNLDNGTGKIRGVYLQGNSAVKPIFEAWLAPFADLGAKTLTLSNTGGTDHLSFDGIGLPGFQFIQDEIEYDARTHHSNQDVFDRIQADDMKQAATIMAAFVYQTAMMDEKLSRKPLK